MSFCDEDLRMIKLPQKTYEFIELSVASLFSELEITKYPIDPFDIIERKAYSFSPDVNKPDIENGK